MAGPSPRKKNVKALLRGSQRAVRNVKICTRADLVDEAETVEARIRKAKETDSLAPDVSDLEARLAELREQMEDASIEFRIRALPRREFTKLITENPAREDNKHDAVLGMNIDEVVEQLIRRGTEEPELDAADWEILLGDVLNQATYKQLTNAAWSVNEHDVSIPF